jgi:hypothetical protein
MISSCHFILKIVVGGDANNSGSQKFEMTGSGHFILKIVIAGDANNNEVLVDDKIFADIKKKRLNL